MSRPVGPASPALVVPAVVLALAGIGAAAGAAPLLGRARGAQDAVLTGGLVVLCAVAIVVGMGAAIIAFAAKADFRHAIKAKHIALSRSARVQAIAAILALGAVMAMLTALAQRRQAEGRSLLPSLDNLLGRGANHEAGAAQPWFFAGLLVLTAVTFAVTLLWMRAALAERPHARTREPDLRAVAESARDALALGDDDRAAVLRAYARMEELLARRGTARRAVEAPREFLRRASAAAPPDARRAAAALTALFERARFDPSPVTAADRAAAAAALDTLAGAA